MGQNCMDCHKQGGDGEGWFTAAGTVYDSADKAPLPNGIVKLYSGRNATGSVVATIQVDAKGNFYTTEKIDFAPGLHPVVSDQATKTVYMADSTTSGSCNSCHGVSTPHIRVY